MTPEALALERRQAYAAEVRDRMRRRCAEESAKRAAQHPGPAPVVPRVVIDLGPNAQLAIRNRVAFTFGPLRVILPTLDQAKISAAMFRLQAPARSWPDGTMRGIKRLICRGDDWISPTMGTVWKEGTCSAEDFDENGTLRGLAGIHAVWPDKLEELNGYEGRVVEIAGWGQCTVADLGWRAQHARVVRELL